jgi:hypothetical protein
MNDSCGNWSFSEPKNLAVITTKQVVEENQPILYVVYDDEGEWQFHTGEDVNESDARVVGLGEIFKQDPTIAALAELPIGSIATRKSKHDDWQCFKDSIIE